ncbi:MAG: toxin-antitoxin system HicB family antitoxin [Acidobacteria bacterium]|nr:toxin-antitoxin system HicB family antitoxin [Acidobacteriota bacterium]
MGDTTVLQSSARRVSGKFLLRMDPGLHAALSAAAAAAGISLNEYCIRKLAAPAGNIAEVREAGAIVRRAASLFGAQLIAVAAFGSWARGEQRAPASPPGSGATAARDTEGGSDADVLVVLEPSIAIERGLYRMWDEEPLRLDTLPVAPHFVHLPEDPERAGGLWAEVALDGIVLFERSLRLSRMLGKVRRAIVAGTILRKEAGGQTYWVREG